MKKVKLIEWERKANWLRKAIGESTQKKYKKIKNINTLRTGIATVPWEEPTSCPSETCFSSFPISLKPKSKETQKQISSFKAKECDPSPTPIPKKRMEGRDKSWGSSLRSGEVKEDDNESNNS